MKRRYPGGQGRRTHGANLPGKHVGHEDEDPMTGLVSNLEGKHRCGLTGRQTTDVQSECAERGESTDNLVDDSEEERWRDVSTRKLQDAAQDRGVLTPPTKKVREEFEEMQERCFRRVRVGEVQVPVKLPPQRKQPLWSSTLAGV